MIYNANKMKVVADEMVTKIENVVDNSSGYKVCIIGTMENGNYPDAYMEIRESIRWTTPYYRIVWESYDGTQNCWKNYILNNAGKNYEMCS